MSNLKLKSQQQALTELLSSLDSLNSQAEIELELRRAFSGAPAQLEFPGDDYYAALNHHLYQYILKHYKYGEQQICLWRYFKSISTDQLDYWTAPNPILQMVDQLTRIYFYSDPLDDLTCLFVPINDITSIKKYIDWIKSYFYDVNYPTSLLWLYALDSSLASLFPEEIVFLGRRLNNPEADIILPDFEYADTVLLKRYSTAPHHYVKLSGENANCEFQQIFTFLQQEYQDRCLSHSGQEAEEMNGATYRAEWEKFEDVLRFGVSDHPEGGCISFSDLRSSTDFLNTFGKGTYLNKIQQPFFERTKLISRKYRGRIDKFMGDNVMCVFLNRNLGLQDSARQEKEAVLRNLCAVFRLTQVLYEIIEQTGYAHSKLGLRSGVTYGDRILRSNLGNEIVRDFTVTGETVNLAARLEHISMSELIIHNQTYFRKPIERFPQINDLVVIEDNFKNLNPETRALMQDYTLYQNILSNLEKLAAVKFDIRFNGEFYFKLRGHLLEKGYELLNPDTADIYGYEAFAVEGFTLNFYFSYYNPKGFNQYEKIWILPLDLDVLQNMDIEMLL